MVSLENALIIEGQYTLSFYNIKSVSLNSVTSEYTIASADCVKLSRNRFKITFIETFSVIVRSKSRIEKKKMCFPAVFLVCL